MSTNLSNIFSIEEMDKVLNLIHDGIVVHEEETGNIVAINKSATEILGYSEDDILGKTTFDPQWRAIRQDGSSFEPQDRPSELTRTTGERQSNIVMGLYRADDDIVWIKINSDLEEVGDKKYVIVSFSDITAQIEDQSNLELKNEELETINKHMIGREGKLIEQKKKIRDLEDELGR